MTTSFALSSISNIKKFDTRFFNECAKCTQYLHRSMYFRRFGSCDRKSRCAVRCIPIDRCNDWSQERIDPPRPPGINLQFDRRNLRNSPTHVANFIRHQGKRHRASLAPLVKLYKNWIFRKDSQETTKLLQNTRFSFGSLSLNFFLAICGSRGRVDRQSADVHQIQMIER